MVCKNIWGMHKAMGHLFQIFEARLQAGSRPGIQGRCWQWRNPISRPGVPNDGGGGWECCLWGLKTSTENGYLHQAPPWNGGPGFWLHQVWGACQPPEVACRGRPWLFQQANGGGGERLPGYWQVAHGANLSPSTGWVTKHYGTLSCLCLVLLTQSTRSSIVLVHIFIPSPCHLWLLV